MIKNKLLLLMANFIHGAQNAVDFSYSFPEELAEVQEDLEKEDPVFAREMDEMPEICASFDPYQTGEPDTQNEEGFRAAVTKIYLEALGHSVKKVS